MPSRTSRKAPSSRGPGPRATGGPSPAATPTFLEELLLKTSRTFALSVPRLPEPTRCEVTVAYLLFRTADTLEDATRWPRRQQLAELQELARLVRLPDAAAARTIAARWTTLPPCDHAGYRELLGRLPDLLEVFGALSPGARTLVGRHTLRTIRRMASFLHREEGRPVELANLDDLRDYCYAVAGIVGEMLTELFLLGRPALRAIAPALRRDAATFGEALQLVNILKDADADAREGRRYLPAECEAHDVFRLARRDLETAQRYVLRLDAAGAPRGVVAFTALPVLLARATLDVVERRGPGAKIGRDEVAAAVRRLDRALEDRSVPALWDPPGASAREER